MIIVTAQRREQSLQDVPVTITAFGQQQIEEKRLQGIEDVSSLTPGLSFDAFPQSQPRPFIRGIGSPDTGAAGDPSVGIFLDDVYLGRPAAVAFDVFDVERIEVLKGPQGTLFGRNVVGGALRVITARADPREFALGGEVTYGNFDRIEVAGMVNAPFAEGTGAFRVSGSYRTHDGFVTNRFTGNRLDDKETLSGRAKFYGELTPNLETEFTIDGTRDRANGPAQYVFDLDTSSPASAFWTVSDGRGDTAPETDGFQNRDTFGVRNGTDLTLPFGVLSFIGSYRHLDYASYYDFDGGNPTYNLAGLFVTYGEDSEFSSQELRLSSLPESELQWVVGAYHFNQQVDRTTGLGLYRRRSLSAPVAPSRVDEIYDQEASLDSVAIFADITVPVTDRLNLFGGLRYSKDDKDYTISNLNSTGRVRATELFRTSAQDSFDAITWRVGGDFEIADDQLLFAKVSRGFKSGGFQDTPSNAASAVVSYEPEFATQYEIGYKAEFFDGRLVWNNSLYYTDYTNLQTRRVIGLLVLVDNAGTATIKGYETQATLRFIDNFDLGISYAYTDAVFEEYIDGDEDFSGNQLSRTPKHKLIVSPALNLELGSWDLRLSGDYTYTSKIFDDNTNNALEIRDPSHFVDARIELLSPSRQYALSLWVENLTNEVSRTFQATFFGANFGALTPPRTYGATLRVNY